MKHIGSQDTDKRIEINLQKKFKTDEIRGIMSYGTNNDYPEIIERIVLSSTTAKSVTSIFAKFIAGSGFENEEIGKIEVGRDNKGKKITLDSMRMKLAYSCALFGGARLFVNPNLDKEILSTRYLPFKNCRLSAEDDTGYCGKIAYSRDWSKAKKNDVSWYYHFNLEALESNVEDAGGSKLFKGQVYSLDIDDYFIYPVAPLDAVHIDADTESQTQIFRNREIREGFSKKSVLLLEEPADENEAEILEKEVKSWQGADGKKVLTLYAKFNEEGELISSNNYKHDVIDSNIDAKVLEGWDSPLTNNIRKSLNVPAVLIDYEQGQLSQASGEMIVQAVKFFNGLTRDYRIMMSEMFRDVYSNFNSDVLRNNTNWELKEFEILDNEPTVNY